MAQQPSRARPTPDDYGSPRPDDALETTEPPFDVDIVRNSTRRPGTDSGAELAAEVMWVADAGEGAASRDGLYVYPPGAAVPRDRIVALNQIAADFYADAYPDSWAAGYISDRLGAVADEPEQAQKLASFRLGYAPDAWTALTDHQRSGGAADPELLAAGLSNYAFAGRLIDTFRDRLAFPITAAAPNGQTEIHGFIARRNPTHDTLHIDQAVRRLLNTTMPFT